jgi:hypothetical protein
MKFILGTLLLTSSFSFAQSLTATNALLEVLPRGEFHGETVSGEPCSFSLSGGSSRISVSLSANGQFRKYEISSEAVYRSNPGNRSYLASVYSGSKETLFRTIAITSDTQYVVIADGNAKLECEISVF